jgi:fatty-acyl-CoA synthase
VPVLGHAVAVVDEDGAPLPDRHVGEIVVRGPSVCAGYIGDAAASAEVFRDGWLQTGDLGFRIGDELFVGGRRKELIIINGRNYHPQDIETVVERVAGLRPGKAAAFAVEAAEGEKLVVVLERVEAADVARAVEAGVRAAVGVPVHRVAFVPALARTSSGKVSRHAARRAFEARG